jgi:uncharacterized cupin superfamily protein
LCGVREDAAAQGLAGTLIRDVWGVLVGKQVASRARVSKRLVMPTAAVMFDGAPALYPADGILEGARGTRNIVTATAATVDLGPEPIPPDWILSGTPEARSRKLATSHDWTSSVVVWDCTEGRFNWHYSKDEALVVLSGEVFITNEIGEERRLGPGDLGFFPAGSSCTWNVTARVRKVAVVRETLWRPLGLCVKVLNKLLRVAGVAGKSPLML